jgi:hypothetical protein
MQTKQELKEVFSKNIVNLSFKKVDGSERTMKCTLDPMFIPRQDKQTSSKKKIENENVLPVWNIDEQGFRSFRVDSLISYDIVKG